MSCTVPIIITWQDWIGQPPLRLEHQLDFCRDGGCWDYGVDLHAALTGNFLEDLAQAQSLQRQNTMVDMERQRVIQQSLLSLENVSTRQSHMMPNPGPSQSHLDDLPKPLLQSARRKRVGPFSAAWTEMCRRLPRLPSLSV